MATSYLSPGVYVEEVDRGSKPIEAVGTNTVGFLGESMMGPPNQAVLIVNWSQFVKTFGDFTQSTHLAHAVYGFFNNGGSRCFVVNVGAPSSLEIEQAAAAPTAGPAKEGEKKPDQKPVEKKQGGGNTDGLFSGKDNGPGARTGLKCFEEIEEISSSDVQERHEALTDDVDDILDEIDSVLESNAEDFVRQYVQKGGQ